MQLFPTEFPQCPTNEEIIKVQAENPHLNPYYLATAVIPERKVLFEDCYKIYEPYKDNNFLQEIPTRFHQRTWEMYMGVLCIKNGKVLQKRADDQADLQIKTGSSVIHIECTAVTHGDPIKPDTVPKMHIAETVNDLRVYSVPEEKILLRITQSLNDKLHQYKKRIIDGRILERDPYIIALNTGELGYPEHIPNILKAVFGIGYLTLKMREKGLPITSPRPFWSKREGILKANKASVGTIFFEKDESKNISAIIYSNFNVLDLLINPAKEDIILVHNPLAINPLSINEFGFLTQYYVDKVNGGVIKKPAEKHDM